MHELAVTENILQIVLKHAERSQASRVTDIYIVVGRLSSIVDDSVQFYWDMVSEGTICAHAVLHFERIPAQMLCQSCQKTYILEAELSPCPECGSNKVQVVSGNEFWVESIEVEKT